MRAHFAVLLVLPVLAQIARGQDEIVLKTDQLLEGQVVESTPDSVTFHHVVDGKAKEMKFMADELDPHSFYLIRKDVLGDDAQAHVVLGQYCMKHGLQTRARNQFIEARKLDPSLKPKMDALMAQSKEEAGEQLVSEADALQKSGKTDDAWRKSVQAVRLYGDTAAGEQARTMVGQLHGEKEAARAAKAAEASADKAQHDLDGVHKLIQEAAALNTKGLTTKEQTPAIGDFERSAKKYQSALDELGKLASPPSGDEGAGAAPSGSKQVEDLRTQTIAALVEVYLNAGHAYMVRTDYRNALAQANLALAIDPKSSSALAFRAQVGEASSDDDYGDYVPWGRIRRPVIHRAR